MTNEIWKAVDKIDFVDRTGRMQLAHLATLGSTIFEEPASVSRKTGYRVDECDTVDFFRTVPQNHVSFQRPNGSLERRLLSDGLVCNFIARSSTRTWNVVAAVRCCVVRNHQI
jgi:hypothetical protein